MEPKQKNTSGWRLLISVVMLCAALSTKPSSAIEIYADPEAVVENGTTGILRCTFKSNVAVGSKMSVTWNFQSSNPDNQYSNAPLAIFYFLFGKEYPEEEYKDRVQFIGDINKRDASIQLSPVQFSDNGTYFCDVKNPPDIKGTPARTVLRVVLKESLPQTNTVVIAGSICGALFLLVLIAAVVCITMRMLHNRHDYEGCTSLESMNSQALKPQKMECGLEDSRPTSPSGPVQAAKMEAMSPLLTASPEKWTNPIPSPGPVIYAQLDHSGSKNSFHKNEPVVYADIRKN